MNNANEHLESLNHIRSIMERSTTFMSLTGLSGILAGIYGLAAFSIVANKLGSFLLDETVLAAIAANKSLRLYISIVVVAALIATMITAVMLTLRKAGKKNLAIWDNVSRRFAAHLFLPLAAGGLFTIVLVHHGQYQLVCASLLLFFGLALIDAARFVQMDMFWLGTVEICLGLIASFWIQGGLILWGVGFGAATLIYGTTMYYKYER